MTRTPWRVTARRFIRRSLDAHPEWRDATLLIDGLDEVRAGGGDLCEPLDALVRRLEELGKPRFRLSCRENSWLGHNDFRELSSVIDGEGFHLLRLDPLTEEDAEQILSAAGVPDPDSFRWKAKDRGLGAFLQNPLLLDILVKAQGSGVWPDGRLATFEWACEALVRETSREHMDARDGSPFANEEVVFAAGRLCAILLLCANSGWSRRGPGNDEFPALSEAGREQPLLKVALDTKLFEGDAETGRRPRHRQIAEFLAARYLDHAISGPRTARHQSSRVDERDRRHRHARPPWRLRVAGREKRRHPPSAYRGRPGRRPPSTETRKASAARRLLFCSAALRCN